MKITILYDIQSCKIETLDILVYAFILAQYMVYLIKYTWALHTFVVVWVDAYFLLLCREWKATILHWLQLMMRLQIWPSPNSTIDHVW